MSLTELLSSFPLSKQKRTVFKTTVRILSEYFFQQCNQNTLAYTVTCHFNGHFSGTPELSITPLTFRIHLFPTCALVLERYWYWIIGYWAIFTDIG